MAQTIHTKKTVFLTGASGNMGQESMKQLLNRSDRFLLRVLVRDSEKNRTILKPYEGNPALHIIWGDLNDYNVLLDCVTGADYVLHIGAFVSPAADDHPKEALRTNYGSTLNLLRAIKEQPNANDIAYVSIGTVAETGCRMPPIHWGRCGDPLKSSVYDYYAVSKIASERAVMESGLKKWVSLRQTGIMPSSESAGRDPIIFHQPPRNGLEWVTSVESGLLVANICEDWVPESFWRNVYNIGGGQTYRLTYQQYYDDMAKPFGFSMKDVFEPWWLARFNFHGQWYTDSDRLNDILKFRMMDYATYLKHTYAAVEEMQKNAPVVNLPTIAQMKETNEAIAHQPRGPLWMQEQNQEGWIQAFFGSRAAMEALPRTWAEMDLSMPDTTPTYLNHGYDETKPVESLDIADMKAAAEFRGGNCLSGSVGDFFQPLQWRCAFGHTFDASPNLVLKGGHWCPECERNAWNYGEIAARNPFFNQVWAPLHDTNERYSIPKIANDLTVLK